MQQSERAKVLEKLDSDLRWFRLAGRKTPEHKGWLREIRLAVGIPATEVAAKAGISRSEVFRGEEREMEQRITLATLERLAAAMDCRVVYAVIPKKGTFKDHSLKRAWDGLFGEDGEKKFKAMMKREMKERNRRPRLPKQEKETKREDRSHLLQGNREETRYYYS
jgi:transcriptional regulator with XRE-family HTH domain